MIRGGDHQSVKRHKVKLEKERKQKLWVAQQRQLNAAQAAETACEAEKELARVRYSVEAKKAKEEMVRRAHRRACRPRPPASLSRSRHPLVAR